MASYGRGILRIDKTGMFLDSGLSSQEFARARMGQHLTDIGYLLIPQKETKDYQVSEFRFSSTKTSVPIGENEKLSEIENVLIVAPPFEGKPLLAFLEGSNRKEAVNAVNAVCAAVEWALYQNDTILTKKIENCGPLGVLVGDDASILFLPFYLFERSMASRDDEVTSELYGCWTNTSLNNEDSWRFTLSACAYTALTGKKAFPELHSEKRTQDYYDDNFIPLEYRVPINADDTKSMEIAHIINFNLGLTGKAHQIIKPVKKKPKDSYLSAQTSSNRPTKVSNKSKSVPLPFPIEEPSHTAISAEFIAAQDKFVEKKDKAVKHKRFLRKYSTRISIAAIILVVIGFATGSIIKTNLEKPTTENMNPPQVLQTFYTALSKLDSLQLDSCGNNKAIKGYSNMVSGLFVTGKMREAYEQAQPFLTPGQWLNTYNPLTFWVFGVTHLDIQENSTWNDIPEKGDTANFTVRFNTIANNGPETYELTAYIDELTLTYGKKYWQITDLSTETKTIAVNNESFRNDMNAALESIEADTTIEPNQRGEKLVSMLGSTYTWLPTEKAVSIGLEELPPYLLFPPAVAQ